MNFAEAIKKETKWTKTENGAIALNTTDSYLLDLFSTIGSLRNRVKSVIEEKFESAYREDKLNFVKTLFYARDIREGLGERTIPRMGLKWLATVDSNVMRKNLHLIAEFGRYDDYFVLIDTPVEKDMWDYLYEVFSNDLENMKNNMPVSLLGKWLKSTDTSSVESRYIGFRTAEAFGLVDNRYSNWRKYRPYKKALTELRKYIKVVETKMCANEWKEIDYSQVPSNASVKYKDAFRKHDEDGYTDFLSKVSKGEAKINANTIYPYDIMRKYSKSLYVDDSLEELWKNLPNYVQEGTNAIVMADTSGSMTQNGATPLFSSVGLAIYFAERNTGAYHNLWMTFSSTPTWQRLNGDSLFKKLRSIKELNCQSTNLKSAFELVLDTAIQHNVSPEEMPKSIIVISDMEIDKSGNYDWTFYDAMRAKFEAHEYNIPKIIFWNVNSRNDVFHSDSNRKGGILCSGQSTTTLKSLLNSIEETPYEYMMRVLNSPRYKNVRI